MSEASERQPVTGLRVVQAGLEHVDWVAPLLDAYRRFYGQDEDVEAGRTFLRDRLGNLQSVIFVALNEVDGREQAVGFAQLYPSFSTVSLMRIWILNDLYVSEEFRQRGVGRALIERARRLAQGTGAMGLVLSTAHDNHGSQALYHAAGFVRDDEFHHYFLRV